MNIISWFHFQNCILDYKTNVSPGVDPSIADDMATAAGFVVDADPALCAAIQVNTIFIQRAVFFHSWLYCGQCVAIVKWGGSGPKISKTCFRDNGWPKRSTHWANFLVGSWGPRPLGATVVATPIFPTKIVFLSKKHQKHDFSKNVCPYME